MLPHLDPDRKVWVHWLCRACHLPLEHAAALLGLEIDDLAVFLARERRGGRVPNGPPRRSSRRKAITGQTGTRVKILQALGYSPAETARFLAVQARDVEDLLGRLAPIRRERLARPRSRTEQARVRAQLPRFRPPPRSVVDPPAAEPWRHRDDVGPDGAPLMSAVVTVAPPECLGEVGTRSSSGVGAPPAKTPTPSRWVGPSTLKAIGSAHGRAKLSEDDATEIRRRCAAGESMYSLAKKYKVARNTIYACVGGKTWKHCLPPASPTPDAEEGCATSRTD